jgi:signal transduction histidine kinase/DNA-binding response OmpR family regulator
MNSFAAALLNVDAIGFICLGILVGVRWAVKRERSLGYLALAIVTLSVVFAVGRVPALLGFTPPLFSELSLIIFMLSGYALLRYRASLIPLPKQWHAAVVIAMAAAVVLVFIAEVLVARKAASTAVLVALIIPFFIVWAAMVIEPIIRFWLVARALPPVQAWRLRSLSLGYLGLVAILIFAIGLSAVGSIATNPAVQAAIRILVLLIIPPLYVSFSPPSWLRREWRASEEVGLRLFMEDLLLLKEDQSALAARALDWAVRLVGGQAAVAFDSEGGVLVARGLDTDRLNQIKLSVGAMEKGVNRLELGGSESTVLMMPTAGLGRMVVVAGPFTPTFGADEMSRVQQFMTAVVAALDRARLTARLREANVRLLEANRHKSVFLASMSHELRTPLNAILGFSELLIDATNGQFPPATRKRFLEQIHSSGKHLLGLINDILDLSKIEAGQMELRLQTVSVAEVAKQALATIEPLAAQKKIEMKVAEMSAGEVTADPGKLKQMLLNLMSNAVKFTNEGGVVTLNATRLDGHFRISVTDTGIGIAPGDQDRVFHEFQQVDSGVGRQQGGTGLGLTLTRRFANLHGGDVTVSSELGKGSVFTITLPVEARQTDTTEVETIASARLDGDITRPLVLVVEDDPPAAELLTRQLERVGFRTQVARTGAEAVQLAHDLKPSAITLDILLPDLDGWEVLTRLKRDETTSEIPVVVVSVVDNPSLGIALGALDYFVKPVPAKELINRLSRFNFNKGGNRKASILVVDDEAPNRDWLKRVLEPAGFSVILASGGKEAIELAKAKLPDLVMLDLMMPETTGFDVVEALRSAAETRATPIMVLTAKHLTEADIRQLNGHVSTILKRGSTGASDLLGLLRQIVGSTPARK